MVCPALTLNQVSSLRNITRVPNEAGAHDRCVFGYLHLVSYNLLQGYIQICVQDMYVLKNVIQSSF